MNARLPLYRVQFQDEAPPIGSGFRFVFVKEGRKWVYLLCPNTVKTCRLRMEKWRTLKPTEITGRMHTRVCWRLRRKLKRLNRNATRLERRAIGIGEAR